MHTIRNRKELEIVHNKKIILRHLLRAHLKQKEDILNPFSASKTGVWTGKKAAIKQVDWFPVPLPLRLLQFTPTETWL